MSHSRRSSRGSISSRSGDPFNDASVLESAYTSSDDDATPVPRRLGEPSSQLAIPYPVLPPPSHTRGDSSASEADVVSPRRGSAFRRAHPPPPVSLQNRHRQQSLSIRRPATSSSGSSDPWQSDSDSLSIASGIVEQCEPTCEDPFATPRKGSIADAKESANRESVVTIDNRISTRSSQFSPFAQRQPRNLTNRESVVTVDNRISTRSSQLSPYAQRQPRRESDQIGPTASPQRGHRRNFSRPFTSDDEMRRSDEQQEKHVKWDPSVNTPMFDPSFNFREGRQGSESMQPEAQLQAQAEQGNLNKERRKSSCVLVNRRKSQYTIEEEKVVRVIGKKRLKWTKFAFIAFYAFMNGGCIAISWLFPQYWWVFAPVILLGNVLNTLMVLNLTRYWLWRSLMRLCGWAKPPVLPTKPTTIAMVLACYCENYDELMATLTSLHAQEGIDHHKKMFLVIVDGQVKGKGMSKSTDRILVEDIFKPEKEEWFPVGYESWDGAINGIYACAGEWRGVPYVCLVKKRNLGKRDGLILVRTLLYKYQFRYENPISSMGDDFFRWFCDFSESLGIDKYEWLVGVDADTTFNTRCIYEMHYKCLQDPRLIGCSGLIQVGFRTGNWNPWNLYQNAEYIRAQCLRRMHQDKGTGKVSCLPGACQIIKICEETCSDKILIDTFGHLPDPKDNMIHQVRALAGEDRNYICIIFKHYPKAITCMAIKAIAFTDPPNGLMVFLSQRKRWTLSTNANDMLITSKNAMNWFERICSFADILVWMVPIFVAQTLILFIKACIHATTPVFILSFATVTIVPMVYGLIVTFWGCNGWREKCQYLLGFAMVVVMGQLVTPVVITYAIWHMDNFAWGKTREVEQDENSKPAHSD